MAPARTLLPLLAFLLTTTSVGAVELKSDIIHISAAMVTLGDIFSDAQSPETEVAKAPPIGKTAVIDYSTLSAIAAGNHLDWHQPGLNGKIVIWRDAEAPAEADGIAKTLPTAANLAAAIEPLQAAMLEQHIGSKMAVTLDPGLQLHYLAALPAEAALTVENLDYAAPTGKFRAVMVDAVSGERQALTGRAIAVLDIPVPAHAIHEGDRLSADDLTTAEIHADKARSDTAQSPAALIGKVAKCALAANQPVQTRFVGQPVMIKRGDRVTMVIQNGPMILTAEGRALDDAGLGESLRLVNAASNRTLQGIVTGTGMVEIHTSTALVAALTPATVSR